MRKEEVRERKGGNKTENKVMVRGEKEKEVERINKSESE